MFLSLWLSLFSPLPLFILVLSVFTFKWLSSSSKTDKRPPPSPPRLPVIGNFHQLSSMPHRSLQALAQNYGPFMLLHLGSIPMLVASSAEAAREIMKTHDLVFSNRGKSTTASIVSYNNQDIVFSPYGEYWRQLKSIALLQLLSNKRVQSYRQVREEETSLMIKTIGESHGSIVNLSELFLSLTNNVICRVALGKKYGANKYKDLLGRFSEILGVFCLGDYVPWLSWVDWLAGFKLKAEKVAIEFDEFLEGVVEEHLDRKIDALDQVQDLVDILLEIQRENTGAFSLQRDTIKGIILDMFVGGTDTTFVTLEWAASELVRNPQVMRKLQEEIKEVAQGKSTITEDDLERMQYLKAVFKEALRLHPPAPLLVPRESRQDIKLMGYDIEAGTQAVVNAWAIGRDPCLWDEPEEFRPERFLNSSIDYEGLHFEFIPFGGGRRGCPGIQFAMAMGELALADLVYNFDLAFPDGGEEIDLDMTETCGVTVHRKSPLLVVATPHSQY